MCCSDYLINRTIWPMARQLRGRWEIQREKQEEGGVGWGGETPVSRPRNNM